MTQDKKVRHQARMQKLKQSVDEKVAQAQEEKGVLLVLTGNGKGKTSSGFGTLMRAVGHGQTAAVAQFIKGEWASPERHILEPLGVEFSVMATGFTWDTQDKESDIAAAKEVWQKAKHFLQDPNIKLVLLDELTYMLSYKYLPLEEVLSALQSRPPHQHVIVTGRNAHRALLELADTVSEVQSQKHAFEQGIKAQQGFDW